MLGISLYSYPYLKLAKMIYLSYYLLCFLFNKIGEVAQTMYTQMNKCINNKKKEKNIPHQNSAFVTIMNVQ
jgi:hypothetical protein